MSFFSSMIRRPPRSTLIPSTTLFRSVTALPTEPRHRTGTAAGIDALADLVADGDVVVLSGAGLSTDSGIPDHRGGSGSLRDWKSTRLNSSHAHISYAAFCLKKSYIWL